jgi:hypothetical protein
VSIAAHLCDIRIIFLICLRAAWYTTNRNIESAERSVSEKWRYARDGDERALSRTALARRDEREGDVTRWRGWNRDEIIIFEAPGVNHEGRHKKSAELAQKKRIEIMRTYPGRRYIASIGKPLASRPPNANMA